MPHRSPENKNKIIELADMMASAATTFNAHGYDNFIQARDEFKKAIESLFVKMNSSKDVK